MIYDLIFNLLIIFAFHNNYSILLESVMLMCQISTLTGNNDGAKNKQSHNKAKGKKSGSNKQTSPKIAAKG